MSFYIIKQDTLIEGSASLDGVPDNIDSLEWIQGKHMPDPGDGVKLELYLSLESGDYRGDIIEGFLTLYSDELKDALEELGVDNVEYYPVVLKDQNTNEREGGFWIANIIGLLDCLDRNKSKIKSSVSGLGIKIASIAIDEAKTNGAKIFRLIDRPREVIINEELKQYFDNTDMLVGVEFIKTEDYSDW